MLYSAPTINLPSATALDHRGIVYEPNHTTVVLVD